MPDGGRLEIDEGAVERSLSLDLPFVHNFDAAEKEWVECVQRALEKLGGEAIAVTEPVFNADYEGQDTIVDVVGGEQRDEGPESEGFAFADALIRVNLLAEVPLEDVVSSSKQALCYSSYFFLLAFSS